MSNIGTQTGTTKLSFTNKIQEMEERLLGPKDTVEEMNTSVKENVKSNKILA